MGPWYDETVGKEGHYYHREIIFPELLKIWNLSKEDSPSVLDLACGQGAWARFLPSNIPYLGLDASPYLIKRAREYNKSKIHHFEVHNITEQLRTKQLFTHISLILALQNLDKPQLAIQAAARVLEPKGLFTIVLNHPCFRIPRQSSWGVDESKKLQYRRIDKYMTASKIPIHAHPGKPHENQQTTSFHWPLSQLSAWLAEAKLSIISLQEWCSNKTSTGPQAKMENRARVEFPLFMAITATPILENGKLVLSGQSLQNHSPRHLAED